MSQTRLDVDQILPGTPADRDCCVARLRAALEREDGVAQVHLVEGTGGADGRRICVHFDPAKTDVPEVRRKAEQAGARLADRYGHRLVRTDAMPARRARTLAGRVRALPGVVEAEAAPEGVLRVEFDRTRTDEPALDAAVAAAVRGLLGPGASSEPVRPGPTGCCAPRGHDRGEWAEPAFAAAAGVTLLAGWLIAALSDLPAGVPIAFYVAAYFFGGFFTVREAAATVLAGKFEIDFLMLVAAAGAAALGEWAEGALLLFLFSLGHALEHFALGRARRAIEALADLTPRTAVVRRDGREVEIPAEELPVGEVAFVKPNERVPADGFVVAGESSVDQAPITGESVPVDKRPVPDRADARARADRLDPAHRVFAGTINGAGALEVEVTRRAEDGTLARVLRMITEAETQKSPTQRFTDRFERAFVPTVLAAAVLLLFAWAVVDEPFSASFYRSMAVLVAASPCALAIATPAAVLSAVARAGRDGVLVKGGGPLERLGGLRAMAFDKTGTLTEGRPRLTDVVPSAGAAEEDLLRVAVAVEALSDHPLASAVVRDGRARLGGSEVAAATGLQSVTGRGVRAAVGGEPVLIGKAELFAESGGPPVPDAVAAAADRLAGLGRTTMTVRRGDRYLGVLGLMDTPREGADAVIRRLRQMGIERIVMLSGDDQRVADAVAGSVGIREARGGLMPEDKVEAVRELGRRGDVAMVGDGVNDAPAMAAAAVGIAMGAAGSDVALETADVALLADDLSRLPAAVGLSRRARSVIRQNLWLSLGAVVFLVPATILGLRIGPAVAFHEGSTLLVVLNALRLLRPSRERGRLLKATSRAVATRAPESPPPHRPGR